MSDLQHMPITMRNEAACREWYERLKKITEGSAVSTMQIRIAEAIRRWPDVLDYLTPQGRFNPLRIRERADSIIRNNAGLRDEVTAENKRKAALRGKKKETLQDVPELLTESRAVEIAHVELQDDWTLWLKDNIECAKILYFDVASYPTTLPAYKAGITCIQATFDRTNTPTDIANGVDSDPSSDFWLDVTAHEVATYCDRFCASISGDVLVDLVRTNVGHRTT